ATLVNETTRMLAEHAERGKDEGQDLSAFVAEVIRYPRESLGALYEALVGLDEIKNDLFRKLTLLLNPRYLNEWVTGNYRPEQVETLVHTLQDRYPLLILAGEVGSGKTALARSIGHYLAARLELPVVLYVVNAQVRGGGHVGELTMNISRAFDQ